MSCVLLLEHTAPFPALFGQAHLQAGWQHPAGGEGAGDVVVAEVQELAGVAKMRPVSVSALVVVGPPGSARCTPGFLAATGHALRQGGVRPPPHPPNAHTHRHPPITYPSTTHAHYHHRKNTPGGANYFQPVYILGWGGIGKRFALYYVCLLF